MNYQITEDEYNQLAAVRGQLGLVCGLLTARGANTGLIDADDLYQFLESQQASVRSVIRATEERYERQGDESAALNWIDWLTVIRALIGVYNPLRNSLDDVLSKMEKAALVDPDMGSVLKELSSAMVVARERGTAAGPASGGSNQKRRRVATAVAGVMA